MKIASRPRTCHQLSIVLLLVTISAGQTRLVHAQRLISPVECTALTIEPLAPAYQPSQPVTIRAQGMAPAGVATIELFYAPTSSDLTQYDSWTEIPGTFVGGELTALSNLPTTPGEYVLAANVVESTTDEVCGGNPGFPGCPGGITMGNGWDPVDEMPCLGCHRLFRVGPTPGTTPTCSSFSLSPEKAVYGAGEDISLTVVGADPSGDVSEVHVFFAKFEADTRNSDVWHELNGTFNPANNTWTCAVNTNTLLQTIDSTTGDHAMGGGELILSPNVYATSGIICSSNHGYHLETCPLGVAMGGGIDLDDQVPCNGCPRIIKVDPSVNASPPLDVSRYWNLKPGNFWQFTGVNRYATEQSFSARVEVEGPTLICGIPTLPLRYLKNNIYGYWGPSESSGGYDSHRNLRFFTTGYLPSNHWDGNYLGTVGHKVYRTEFDAPTAPHWYTLGTLYQATDPDARLWDLLLYTSHQEHFHYPPYLLSPKLADTNFFFHRQDQLFARGHDEAHFCDDPTLAEVQANRGSHGWKIELATVPRTFAEAGLGTVNALRVKYVEYSLPYCQTWTLREDYYLVEDVGLAEIDVQKWGSPYPACDAQLDADALDHPHVTMTLTGYFAGTAMTLSASPNPAHPDEAVTISLPGNYEGRVEREVTIARETNQTQTDDWGGQWISDGQIVYSVPDDSTIRQVQIRLRPPVPENPSLFEPLIEVAEAEWSAPLTIPIQACGNSVQDPGEDCDNTDLASATCRSLGFAGGALGCTGSCTFDVGNCTSLEDGLIASDGGPGDSRPASDADTLPPPGDDAPSKFPTGRIGGGVSGGCACAGHQQSSGVRGLVFTLVGLSFLRRRPSRNGHRTAGNGHHGGRSESTRSLPPLIT